MSCQRFSRLLRLPCGFRQYATRTKVDIDPDIIKSLQRCSFRKHPGQTQPRKVARMPQDIEDAIMKILKEENYDALINNGMAFVRHLHGRHAPLEEDEKELLARTEEQRMQEKLLKKEAKLSPEQYAKQVEKAQTTILRRTKVKENLWKPINYDDQACFQYLLLRAPADYAVLKAILSEIAIKDPDFQPRSLLDFGSGVGTVSWVVEELWKTCKEFYNVDISTTMRDLAGLVLRRGNPQTELPPSIFFKGFLPTSLKYSHDIVVSAYSLIELPSRKQRLETLLSLWNKTDSYLVVVEDGTYAGYKLVIEARDFILEMSEREAEVAGETGAHVFAPCSHEKTCPKFLTSKYPCNFEVTYMQHPNVQSAIAVRERYSYVVLKKGPREPNRVVWPRITEPVKQLNNHCIGRFCTPEGELAQVIFTKSKNADGSYKLMKKAEWGDTVPFILSHYDDGELSSTERYRLKFLEKRKKAEKNCEDNHEVKEADTERKEQSNS